MLILRASRSEFSQSSVLSDLKHHFFFKICNESWVYQNTCVWQDLNVRVHCLSANLPPPPFSFLVFHCLWNPWIVNIATFCAVRDSLFPAEVRLMKSSYKSLKISASDCSHAFHTLTAWWLFALTVFAEMWTSGSGLSQYEPEAS